MDHSCNIDLDPAICSQANDRDGGKGAAKRSTEMRMEGTAPCLSRCRLVLCPVVRHCVVGLRQFSRVLLGTFLGQDDCGRGHEISREGYIKHATQSERAAELPFAISGRPLCSAPSVSSGLLSFPSAGAASVVGFAVCCILRAFSSAHPRSPPLLRLCSPPRGLLSLSSVAVAVVSPSARGVASGTAGAAVLLRLLGEGALRC